MKKHTLSRSFSIPVMLLLGFGISLPAFAQFNYGTGNAAGNPGGFTNNNTVISANTTMPGGTYNFVSFTVNAGDTVTVSGGAGPLIIRCQGTATINGVITAAGDSGYAGVGSTGNPQFEGGAGGAGGGGWGGAGGVGGTGGYPYSSGSGGAGGGQFGTFNGAGYGGHRYTGGGTVAAGSGGGYDSLGAASSGNATLPSYYTYNTSATTYGDPALVTTATVSGITTNLLGGSGGGGGGSRCQSVFSTSIWGGCGGGGGGGAIQVTAYNIALGIGSLLTVRGGNGGSATYLANNPALGAGGGGSGGTINLQYSQTLTGVVLDSTPAYDSSATVDIGGGLGGLSWANAGSYYTIGGQGGQGRFLAQLDNTVLCTAPTLAATANGTSGSINICTGNVTLTANAIGGSGCTNYIEYAWSNGTNYWDGSGFTLATGTYSQADSTITITQAAGTNTYTVTARCNATPSCSASSSVTVTAAAQPTAPATGSPNPSGTTACAGTTVTLNGAPTGGNAGLGCGIEYWYSTDGGNTWSTPSATIPSFTAVAGAGKNIIQARRNNCQAGCTGPTNWSTVATWTGINGPVIPTGVVSAPQTTICAGNSVTFIDSISNGGTTPVFQWYKNGNPVGADTSVYTDGALANQDSVWCVMTSNASCVSTNIATSNVVTITVLPVQRTTVTASICQGMSYDGHTTSNTFIDTFSAANTCDSIRTLHLTVLQPITTTVNASICQGQSYDGHTNTGAYTDTFVAANNCDSIRYLNLSIKLVPHTTISHSICSGQTFDGYDSSGMYNDTFALAAADGCDSIRTLILTVSSAITTTVDTSICTGRSYAGYTTTGTFVDHLTSSGGCDSIRTLNLVVDTVPVTVVKMSGCQGDTVQGHTTSGNYTDTLSGSVCDSLVVLELQIYPVPAVPVISQSGNTLTASPAGSYFYNWFFGTTLLNDSTNTLLITQSGNYSVQAFDTALCSNTSGSFAAVVTGIATTGQEPLVDIYPNPAVDKLNISLSGLSVNQELVTRLYDVTGRMIIDRSETTASPEYGGQLTLRGISRGVYFLQLRQGSWNVTRKLIITE